MKETDSHKRGHNYYVLDKFQMKILQSDWTARNEFMIIYEMMHNGLVWSDITIDSKSSDDLFFHFYQYIYNFQLSGKDNLEGLGE